MTTMTILGAGSWGRVLASLCSQQGHDVVLWARADSFQNLSYDQRISFSPQVHLQSDLSLALRNAELVLFAVPSHAVRQVAAACTSSWTPHKIVVMCAKGLEPGTSHRLSRVVADVLPGALYSVLSGPNLAAEITAGQPAAAVVASDDATIARHVQTVLSNAILRLYTSTDVIGVEMGGALKNCIAIAAGIADGLALGVNSRSALITRGLAEMVRLGVAVGAQPLTFLGLAGLGDLVATCSSTHSRNHQLGVALAQGLPLTDAQRHIGHVAEGVTTTREAYTLARRLGVRTPIIDGVYALLYEGQTITSARTTLLSSPPGEEMEFSGGLG